MEQFIIRHSTEADLPDMLRIVDEARQKMRGSGNMLQWADGYPGREQLVNDIKRRVSYVVESGGKVVATFAFITDPDPTYTIIYNGEWLDDTRPYGTIHRIASCHGVHKVGAAVFDWCYALTGNLRVDTHRDNTIMRHVVEKCGFTYCGIIHLLNGDERLAYQRP